MKTLWVTWQFISGGYGFCKSVETDLPQQLLSCYGRLLLHLLCATNLNYS